VNATGTFINGRNSDAANIPDAPYPRIHFYPFIQTRSPLDLQQRTSTILMAFVKADTGNNDVLEREEIIGEMGILCDTFVDELESANTLQFESVRTEPLFNVLDGVSGFSLELTIVSIAGC
jgi:hypothetical protein